MDQPKNPAAVALARKRWAGATEEDKDVVRENGRKGGRPRSDAPRCPCGTMTLNRAQARGKSGEHDPSCDWYRESAIIV
jgi:hypothetical protein